MSGTLFFAGFSCGNQFKPESENTGWNSCGAWPPDKAFGIWLVDTLGGRELIYQDAEIGALTPIPVRANTR